MFGKFIGKIIKGMFSQLVIVCVLLVLQIGLFAYLMSSIYSSPIRIILYFLSAIVVVYIINSNAGPSYKLAWVVPIMMFPVIGGLFYGILKLQRPRKKSIAKPGR